jgi:hypothetical protein
MELIEGGSLAQKLLVITSIVTLFMDIIQ